MPIDNQLLDSVKSALNSYGIAESKAAVSTPIAPHLSAFFKLYGYQNCE